MANRLQIKMEKHYGAGALDVRVRGAAPLVLRRIREDSLNSYATARTPFEDFLGCLYVMDADSVPRKRLAPGGSWGFVSGAFGVPSLHFRRALEDAARGGGRSAGGLFLEPSGILPLRYEKLVFRMDRVYIGRSRKRHDLRVSSEFRGWSTRFRVRFLRDALNEEAVKEILKDAGRSVGIGLWRPSVGGYFGKFASTVTTIKEDRRD